MFEMDIKTIALILFGIIILYLLYKTRNIEGFATTTYDMIDEKIKTIYNADIDAIRNLSNIATKRPRKLNTKNIFLYFLDLILNSAFVCKTASAPIKSTKKPCKDLLA